MEATVPSLLESGNSQLSARDISCGPQKCGSETNIEFIERNRQPKNLWRNGTFSSKKRNIQFFISTHSDEVLNYFAKTSKETKFTEISIYRLGKRNGETFCTRFSRKEFLQTAEIGAEIR